MKNGTYIKFIIMRFLQFADKNIRLAVSHLTNANKSKIIKYHLCAKYFEFK